jgi:hypothetical protein
VQINQQIELGSNPNELKRFQSLFRKVGIVISNSKLEGRRVIIERI